ncbi:NAD(P)(+) transhydrogenase (Re/Si-specific) subunit beta, partial [Spongiibacter tropicus]
MGIELLVNLSYVAAAVLFIFGLKMLGSPATARKGNLVSAVGMFIAVVITLLDQSIIDYKWIAVGIVAGGVVGAIVARSVAMTSMPEMVALFNGFGGIASLFIGWAALYGFEANAFELITIVLSILIGGVTFTGSLIAYGKLSERMPGRPLVFGGQRVFNILLILAIIASAVMFVLNPGVALYLYLVIGLSCLLGIMLVIPIGGADMPVVISLLNSYSGLAACAAGFAINNIILIVAGSLVGASG